MWPKVYNYKLLEPLACLVPSILGPPVIYDQIIGTKGGLTSVEHDSILHFDLTVKEKWPQVWLLFIYRRSDQVLGTTAFHWQSHKIHQCILLGQKYLLSCLRWIYSRWDDIQGKHWRRCRTAVLPVVAIHNAWSGTYTCHRCMWCLNDCQMSL